MCVKRRDIQERNGGEMRRDWTEGIKRLLIKV
jgi:hypothetical protein